MTPGPNEIAELLNHLQWWSAVLLVVWLVVWRAFAFWDKRAGARERASERKAVDEAKTARAERYACALDSMTTGMRDFQHGVQQALQSVTNETRESRQAMHRVDAALIELAARQSGVMSFDESAIVYEALFAHVRRETQYIIEESLRENNYKDRSEFISRKVRTQIGKIIEDARGKASRLGTLSIPPDRVFKTYIHHASSQTTERTDEDSDRQAERYVLCDRLWDAVHKCYTIAHSAGIRSAIEEARVIIDNMVTDYFSHLLYKLRKEYAQPSGVSERVGSSSGMHRVVSSGEHPVPSDS